MKTLPFLHLLLLTLILSVIGCGSDRPDPQEEFAKQKIEAEKKEIEREKEELEAKNAALIAEKEEREAAERAKLEEEAKTYSSDVVAGIWNVRMTCTESDCPDRNAGDVISEVWNISYMNGQYQIAVTNAAPNTNKSYSGAFNGKYLRANFAQGGVFSGGSKVRLNLKMKDENTMTGKREVVNDNPCTISYQVVANRSR